MRSLVRRGVMENELDKELRFHLERQTQENIARGMTADEARHAASRRLGGAAQIQEECRDTRRVQQLESTFQDFRYAARTLFHSPGFSVVIVLTMALGIGANSAIFSVIDSVLLRQLPYAQPDRLVRLFLHSREYPKFPLNPFDFRDYRERSRSFESMAAYARDDLQLSGGDTPVRLRAFAITAGFFHVLGSRPQMGREFTRKDELPANGHVVVLSDQLWRQRFTSRPGILGEKIVLNGEPFTVVGVMAAGVAHPGNDYHALAYGETVDAWIPFPFKDNPSNRGSHFIDGIARLKNGVTPDQAQAELNSVMTQMGREHEGDRGWRVVVTPLHREIVGGSQRLLWILLGAVSVVLLIACVNAANLLLARATVRERELALRAAIGGTKSRIIRLLLTESILISLTAAIFGAVIAVAGVRALTALLPPNFPRASDIHVNAAMFLFTLLVALATGVLFGLAPAWQGSSVDLRSSLHDGGRSVTGGFGSVRLRDGLVVCEVALACLLLVGAGLMIRSFANLLRTDSGFRPHGVVTASLSLRTPNYDYAKRQGIVDFYDRLAAKLASNPGVTAVGVGTDLPWTGYNENDGGFAIQGKKPPPDSEFHARYHSASADYFRALGIPLVSGRFFNEHDGGNGIQSLLINSTMARLYFPGESAIGQKVSFEDHPKEKDWMTIVGVVGDVKDTPASDGAEPAFWWPLRQVPFLDVSVAVRGRSQSRVLAGEIRSAVRELDATLAVADVRTLDEITNEAYASSRFALFLISLFALLAVTLAGIGTYGVISYTMSRRSREFGLRIALGAQPRDVSAFVFGKGMKLAAAGAMIGVFGSLMVGRVLANLLYQVNARDPLTIALAGLMTLAAAALACYVPARRATRSDPMNALRAE
jgi:predicted permease